MYLIRMGVPEMISFWDELCKKVKSEKANAEERKLYKKLGKTMRMLSENPRMTGLHFHQWEMKSKAENEEQDINCIDSGCPVFCAKDSLLVRKTQSQFFKAVLLNHLLSEERDSLLRTKADAAVAHRAAVSCDRSAVFDLDIAHRTFTGA